MSNERQACYCAAHGCNQLGTMTSNTVGTSEWWCYLHFGQDAGRLQQTTAEINRRDWLSRIITDVRMRYWSDHWPDTFKHAQHELAMNNRNDLKIAKDETVWQWVRRLEGELQAMVGATFVKPPKQERIQVEGFQRMQLVAPVEV